MKKLLLIAALLVASSSFANSSDTIKKKKIIVDGLKLSGVVQVQWQMSEMKGGDALAQGGKFEEGTDNRVDIRRARFKMLYNYDFVTAAFQINASTTSISLIEAYINLATRSKVAGLTTGVFYKPYGFMMQRSASIRMQPELPRIIQTILPSDIGLGAYATFTGEQNTLMNRFKLNLGILTQDEFIIGNKQLNNFIGRLEFTQPIGENSVLGAEFTTYFGRIRANNMAFSFNRDTKKYFIDPNESNMYQRNYYDFGLRFETKTAWGDTKMFGEYMLGTQPGSLMSSKTMNGDYSVVYNRKFSGGYFYFQQEIATSNLSFVAQFDYYDPNRQVAAKDISQSDISSSIEYNFSASDIAYTTLGVGLYYKFCKNIMAVSAYYDFVWNEKSYILPHLNKNIKDNVFTLRLQCAF